MPSRPLGLNAGVAHAASKDSSFPPTISRHQKPPTISRHQKSGDISATAIFSVSFFSYSYNVHTYHCCQILIDISRNIGTFPLCWTDVYEADLAN